MGEWDDMLGRGEYAEPKTEQPEPLGQTARMSANGLTLELDLHQLLTALDPQGSWLGYNPETDENEFEQASLADHIVLTTSQQLVKVVRKEVRDRIFKEVSDVMQAEIVDLVRDALDEGVPQKRDQMNRLVGDPVPLRDLIQTMASDMLTKPTGDSYSRNRPTALQKMIEEQVGAAFKKELADVVAQAKGAALKAVQDNAASVIRETIERSSRGL